MTYVMGAHHATRGFPTKTCSSIFEKAHEFVFGELELLEIDAQRALAQIVSGMRLPQ